MFDNYVDIYTLTKTSMHALRSSNIFFYTIVYRLFLTQYQYINKMAFETNSSVL